MAYVYPAIFHPNNDGSITVIFPDLPGCISEGKNLENAMYMAQDALTGWLEYHSAEKINLPNASAFNDIAVKGNEFVNLIRAEIKDTRAVRRNVSVPRWLDNKASEAGLSLSRVLQDALIERVS